MRIGDSWDWSPYDYSYSNGRLATQTLPSGNVVTYGYNANGQVTSVLLGATTIVNNVTYDSFGPVTGWSWGNGQTHTRSFDQDGRVTALTTSFAGGINQSYLYDAASRMAGITDTGTTPNSWTVGYDSLDRAASALGPTQTQGWTYDANSNRLTETGTQAATFTVSPTSNRLSSTVGAITRTYAYDAAGNALSYEDVVLAYNNRNRLISTQKGASTRVYVYNALGQLAKASGGAGGTVHYVHDEAGHLIGEYNATGALVQETIWLGDLPLATIRSGTPVEIFYVHADHLGTPVRVTRPSDNKRRWQWNKDPFGTLPSTENPEALGVFAYNLRFPGQLFDGQAGLHQNMFRDYSPAIGRYVESDPIGLKGGVNTYGYAGAQPVLLIDPFGLACIAGARFLRDQQFTDLSRRDLVSELNIPFIGPVHADIGPSPEPPQRTPRGLRGPGIGLGPNLTWDIVYFKWEKYRVTEGYSMTRFYARKYYCKADDPCQQPQQWTETREDKSEWEGFIDHKNDWVYKGMFQTGYKTSL